MEKEFAKKILELAKALDITEIVDSGRTYTTDDFEKLYSEGKYQELIDLLDYIIIETLKEEKHYPSELAEDLNTIYEEYYDKEDSVLDYKYDLNIFND